MHNSGRGQPVLLRQGSAIARGHEGVCSQNGFHPIPIALQSTCPVCPHPGELPAHCTPCHWLHTQTALQPSIMPAVHFKAICKRLHHTPVFLYSRYLVCCTVALQVHCAAHRFRKQHHMSHSTSGRCLMILMSSLHMYGPAVSKSTGR